MRARREVSLPQADVDPFAELEPDSPVDSGLDETKPLVKRDADRVGERDRRDRGHVSLSHKPIEKLREQFASQAAASRLGCQIDAGLDVQR